MGAKGSRQYENRSTSFDDALEAIEDVPTNRSSAEPIGDIVARRYSRRAVMKLGFALGAVAGQTVSLAALAKAADTPPAAFDFAGTRHGVTADVEISPDHDYQVLLRWGDPIFKGAPEFDPLEQSEDRQAQQFGYNNDHIAFFPLPFGTSTSDRGVLCINHEYTSSGMMFPGLGHFRDKGFLERVTKEQADIEMAAHGATVVEVFRDRDGQWRFDTSSPLNRRITASRTHMRLSGPAAGHRRLRTAADPTGTRVLGTVNNCAGGVTPWGTYLMAEENINFYFAGQVEGHLEERNYKRLGIGLYGVYAAWSRFYDRFDINREPNEPNRFGWIVEFDPSDPNAEPVKRTALGRFKHEGASPIVNESDGRLVVYMGDDQRFDYVYRFVSDAPVSPDREKNKDLLDKGVLSVAKFSDQTLEWLPLVFGHGPLTPKNDFHNQADVLIEARRAADLLDATPMDRPEDVQPNPRSGTVHVMLTNNVKRPEGGENAPNPRANNRFGHIIDLVPPNGNHTARQFEWRLLVKCGPFGQDGSSWNPLTDQQNGWFAAPDNCAIDPDGRLWITTDQGDKFLRTETSDGIWALETTGERRGIAHMLFRAPVGAEVTGPEFTPDGETLFLSVQHPGVDVKKDFRAKDGTLFEGKPTFDHPATRWPDFKPGMPPRPSVLAITRKGGGKIG